MTWLQVAQLKRQGRGLGSKVVGGCYIWSNVSNNLFSSFAVTLPDKLFGGSKTHKDTIWRNIAIIFGALHNLLKTWNYNNWTRLRDEIKENAKQTDKAW